MQITEKREKQFYEQFYILNFSEHKCFFTTTIKNKSIYVHFTVTDKDLPTSESSTLLSMVFTPEEREMYLAMRTEIISYCKNIAKENIEVSEKEFLNHFKQFKPKNFWFNPIIDFEQNKNNNNYSNSNKYTKKTNDDSKIAQIKPYVLLETLKQNGIISGYTEQNTRSEIFWVFKLTTSYLSKPIEFKASVKKLEEIRLNPSDPSMNVFKEVRIGSKGYPASALGLTMFLGDNGLFSEKANTREEKVDRAKKFLLSIYNSINKINLFDFNHIANNSQDYKFPSYDVHRLPFKEEGETANIIEYLTVDRKISRDTVNLILNQGMVYNGSFYMNSFVNRKPSPIKQIFFEMKDKDGNSKCTERYDIKKIPKDINGVKVYENKAEKKFTHLAEGHCFKIMNDNAKVTYLSEGIPDLLSLRDFVAYSGNNPDNANYWSIPGVTSLGNILATHLNIAYEVKDDEKIKKLGKIYYTEEIVSTTILTKEEIEKNARILKDFNFVFLANNSKLSNKLLETIEILSPLVDIKVKPVSYREEELNYEEFGTNTIYLDETNFADFFKRNNITIALIEGEKKICSLSKKEKIEPLNDENIEKIKQNIQKYFNGANNFVCAFDQDTAGKSMIPVIEALNEYLGKHGIYFFDGLPNPSLKMKDWNELLKEYVAVKNKDIDKANDILADFNSKFDMTEKKNQYKQINKPT